MEAVFFSSFWLFIKFILVLQKTFAWFVNQNKLSFVDRFVAFKSTVDLSRKKRRNAKHRDSVSANTTNKAEKQPASEFYSIQCDFKCDTIYHKRISVPIIFHINGRDQTLR